jgi:two-component system, OmpR family, sensor histidine kinase SenX3
MKFKLGDRLFSGAVVLLMTAVLVTLAILQYRWSNQVSQATSERMEVDLESTMMRLRDDLYREMAGFCFRLEINPELPAKGRLDQYAKQFEAWSTTAAYPTLVTNVYVLQEDAATAPRLLHLVDVAKGEFQLARWPSRYEKVQQRIQAISTDLAVAATRLKSPDELRQNARRNTSKGQRARSRASELAKQFPVMIDQEIPALVEAVYHHPPSEQSDDHPSEIDWVILELDRSVLGQQILPRLVTQYFGEARTSTYQVAVMHGSGADATMYSSDPAFPGKGGAEPDEDMRLFGPPFGPQMRGTDMILLPAFHTQTPDGKFHENNDLATAWPIRVEPIHYTVDDDDWHMLARHRKGSLEAAVNDMKRRNLAVSFAVLLLLGASMGMLLVSSRRAHTLARLQMDFVAAVSHELRTPLAVICSAADNIADGVVGDQRRMEQYGGAIKSAARQLIHLVEQVLMYASTRNNRHRYSLAPLRVSEIVDAACANTAAIVSEAGVKLECYVDPGLPPVMGDQAALAHCLQNLITNAVKYGGDRRWVGIRAKAGRDTNGGDEIQISVEDKGLGIASEELKQIFEPFYRSRAAVSSQIRGTGLGLALARTIAEGMGGRLTVTSVPGQGSSFVLHLPATEQQDTRKALHLTPAVSEKSMG